MFAELSLLLLLLSFSIVSDLTFLNFLNSRFCLKENAPVGWQRPPVEGPGTIVSSPPMHNETQGCHLCFELKWPDSGCIFDGCENKRWTRDNSAVDFYINNENEM